MANIYAWSVTAADNDDADFASWGEGVTTGAHVNNGFRDFMAAFASWLSVPTTTGSNPNFAATVPGLTALADGVRIRVKTNAAITGGATLNVNSLGAAVVNTMAYTNIFTGSGVASGETVDLIYVAESADVGNPVWVAIGGLRA
jgi:hypothetical protein